MECKHWDFIKPFLAFFRSSTNLHTTKSRSTRSVRIPWYQRPILKNNQYIDIQKNAMMIGLFAIVSKAHWAFLSKLMFLLFVLVSGPIYHWHCNF